MEPPQKEYSAVIEARVCEGVFDETNAHEFSFHPRKFTAAQEERQRNPEEMISRPFQRWFILGPHKTPPFYGGGANLRYRQQPVNEVQWLQKRTGSVGATPVTIVSLTDA